MKKNCCFILFVLIFRLSFAQVGPSDPRVPGIASLGSLIEPEVAMYSGAMHHSVPFYELELYKFKLPINFTYSYNGLRYSDDASQVGLHWSLGIPSIRRSVSDNDDFDEEKGFSYSPLTERNATKSDLPDIFTLSTPTENVQFLFLPPKDSNIRRGSISATLLNNTGRIRSIIYSPEIKDITVKTVEGVSYIFGQTVATRKNSKDEYIVQWNISKIILQNKSEINFSYQKNSFKLFNEVKNKYVLWFNVGGGVSSSNVEVTTKYLVDEVYPSLIKWADGEIRFSFNDRTDIQINSGQSAAKKLSKVEVYNRRGIPVQTAVLNQTYFSSGSSANHISKRLRLDGISLYGQNVGEAKQYSFLYDPASVPNKDYRCKYFGYDSVNVTSAALREIVHPSGGISKIKYQPNTYSNTLINIANKHLGVRVSSIELWENTGAITQRKKFFYENPNGTSSGKTHSLFRNQIKSDGATTYQYVTENNWYPPIYQSQILAYDVVTIIEEDPKNLTNTLKTNHHFVNHPTIYPPGAASSTFAVANYNFSNGVIRRAESFETIGANTYRTIKQAEIVSDVLRQPINFKFYFQYPGSSTIINYDAQIVSLGIRNKKSVNRDLFYTSGVNVATDSTILEKNYIYPSILKDDYSDFLPVETHEKVNNISYKKNRYKYAHDFLSGLNVTTGLTDRTMVLEMIELDPNTNVVIGGELTNLKRNINTLPSEFHQLKNLPLEAVNPTLYGRSGISSKDVNYFIVDKMSYDSYDNPIEIQHLNEPLKSYKYDAIGVNLIAKIENCSSNEFYYESFEDYVGSTKGNAVGDYYKQGDFTVPFVKPNTKDYVIDYKYQSSNGVWISVSKSFANNMLLSEGDRIDEVRVYPSDARLTTYTFRSLVGMTSRTDYRGVTEYYEYDSNNRLKAIRDRNQNILKHFEYNFSK